MKLRSSKSFKYKNSAKFTEEKDKWINLENILSRGGPQVGDTDVTLQVYGVYSLPEIFSKLQQSGSVDTWSYLIKFSDIQLPGGKFNPRELTEDELKEMENKKKPAPKINKKDLAAVKAEEDRIAAEQKEKEEKEKAFQDILDKMTPEEQYYYLKELPTKEAWLSWPEGKSISTIKKSGEKFIEFEEDINSEKGCILELQFIPPPDEDPKKRPKPKGLLPEEIKPIYAISWIDFSKLNTTPGLTELELRAKLMTREKYEKNIDELEKIINKKVFNPYSEEYKKLFPDIEENKNETENKNDNTNNENPTQTQAQPQPQTQNQNQTPVQTQNSENNNDKDFLEKAETYIRIRIMLSQPVNPVLPDVELPEPIDFIKKEKPPKKQITTEEIEQDLIRQFKIAIAAIAKVYDEAMGESAKGNLMKREKGNILASSKKEDKEQYILKFLDKFNTSGRADLLKEKLKKFIVRIVREKFGKKKAPVKGVYRDERDQFYSELYAYLTDTLKTATNEFVELKKDELHENIITPFSQSKKEIMEFITRENKEPEDKRLLRLSKENELLNDYSKAVKYYKSRLLLDPNREAWLAYLNLTKKLEDIPEVENSLVNAISIDPENCDLNLQLIFCGLLYIKGKIGDAINYLNLYILKNGLNSTNYVFNAFLSFLYKEKANSSQNNAANSKNQKNTTNENLSKKHFEAAKLFKMRSLPPDELKPPPEEKVVEEEEDPKKKKGKEKEKKTEETEENLEELSKKGNPRLHPEFKRPVLNNAQLDSIWFETAILFNRYNFFEISEKLLENATEETKQTIEFKTEQAKVLLFRKEYERVIELCNDIIKEKKLSYNSYILKGHALYYLNRNKEAEETYIKAIRFKPQEINFDIEMLVKLGLIYIKEEKWYDAKVVFKQITKFDPEASYSWRYLGYSLTQLGEYEEAEKALLKANLLDVENPLIWAYLAVFDLNNGKKYQALECFNELNKVNYNDANVMKKIAKLFLDNDEYVIAKNIYLKIKEQEKTDGECYIQIANIYNEKLSQKKEALEILKEGLDKVIDDKYHQEIEKLIKDIEKEEQDLFTGEICDNENENDKENENDNVQMDKISNNESKLKEDNVNINDSKVSNKDDNNKEDNKENNKEDKQ